MKAILQNVKTGSISVDEIPPPVLKPGNVLVRNVRSLVSAGTEKAVLEFSRGGYLAKARRRPDLFRKVLQRARNEGLWPTYRAVTNLLDQPVPLGYSCAGRAIEVGADVAGIVPGRRVACAGLFVAAHAEVVSVPRNLLVPIPDGVSFEEAAFVTLGAIALQGVRLAGVALGENVIVYGLGLVGMVAAQLAIAAGARVLGVDIDSAKVELAKSFGAQGALADADLDRAAAAWSGGRGADKVLLCAATRSNEPIERIPALARQKAVLVVVGDVAMDIPRRSYYDKEIDIRISRSYGPGRYDPSYEEGGLDYPYAYVRWTENRNMEAVLDLAARGRLRLGALVTHRFPIGEAGRAYEIIEGKTREPYLGMLIEYPDGESETAPPPAPSVRYSSAPPRAGVLQAGLIGAGNFARAYLLPAFASAGVRLRSVATASGVSAASVAKKYGADLATSRFEDVVSDGAVDLVIVATRHDSHARYVCQALDSGKPVFVEKPLAIEIEGLDAIRERVEAAERAGRRTFLMVGFNRRFSPLAVRLREVFSKTGGPISVVYRVNAGFIADTEWVHDPSVGGGRVAGECCHFIDFLTFLAGAPPRSLWTSPLRKEGKAVPDVVTIHLEFPGGSIGSIHYFASGHPGLSKEQVEVFGGGLAARLENFRSLKIWGAPSGGRMRRLYPAKGFAEEARAVAEALRSGGPSPIRFSEIYSVSRAAILAQAAILTGERVAL